jgi:hypothetical protein
VSDDWQPGEEWRPVPGSRGYEVSDLGRVRRGDRLLNPCLYSTGYLVADVYFADGTHRRRGVHTLVCEAFIGPRPPLHECCHINGRPSDNRLANLRYGTRRDNMRDQFRHGTRILGERHPMSKLSYEKADAIREAYGRGLGVNNLARKYGVDKKAIQNLLRGKTWVRPELLTDQPIPAKV